MMKVIENTLPGSFASSSWTSISLSSLIRCCSICTRNLQCLGGISFNSEYSTTVCSHVLQLPNQLVTEFTWSRNMLFDFIFIISCSQVVTPYSISIFVLTSAVGVLAGVFSVYITTTVDHGLDILPTSHVVSCFQANILEIHIIIMTNTAIHECTVCIVPL